MKYFVINKQLDYDRGFLQDLEYRDGLLRLKAGAKRGFFFSRLFDSGESGTVWHRFTAGNVPEKCAGLRFSFYCLEEPEIFVQERKVPVADVVRDPRLSAQEKKKLLEPYLCVREAGSADLLLHAASGRYLLFEAELRMREAGCFVGDMFLYFPKDTWMKYLPEVYGKDRSAADFTERFLSIFQSIHDDRGREIRTGAGLMHPDAVGRKLLEELAGWYDLKDLYLWPDDRLRELVRQAPELVRKIGTAAGMREYLRLYTGTEPEILEDPGTDYRITVRVPREYLDDAKEYRSLIRIIGHMKPAGMAVRLLPLEEAETRQSEEKTRLGMTSRLESGTPGGEVS